MSVRLPFFSSSCSLGQPLITPAPLPRPPSRLADFDEDNTVDDGDTTDDDGDNNDGDAVVR